jgi:hypothetical protein
LTDEVTTCAKRNNPPLTKGVATHRVDGGFVENTQPCHPERSVSVAEGSRRSRMLL